MTSALRCEGLAKTFVSGFLRRKVRALHDVTFSVEPGEIFGFLGPNGSGKSTTFKILVGLLSPSAGRAEILGAPAGNRAARARLGYLPENPYFYDYLTGRELLEYAGRLYGLDRATRRRRAGELLEQVGMAYAAERPLRKYSKGMLQRVGVAQALLGNPQLVIFDEPMTGLDPIGRKELRDTIVSLRQRGTTVIFSTHILPDVELICDRVGILFRGRIHSIGPLDSLLSARVLSTEVVLSHVSPELARQISDAGSTVTPRGSLMQVMLPGDADVDQLLRLAGSGGAKVQEVTRRHETLEDVFVKMVAPS